MQRTINTIAMEELFKQNTDGFLPVLIEIYNPDLKWNDGSMEQEDGYLRVVNDTATVKYQGKTYLPCRFDFTPPEENGSSLGTASISVSSIDSRIAQLLGSSELVSEVAIVASFVKSENEGGGTKFMFFPLNKWKFKMSSASYSGLTITLQLANNEVLSLNQPRNIALMDMFPSVNANDS